MQHLVFEFPTENEMRETVSKLWETHKVTGEMAIRPHGDGKWRLEFYTEKEIRDAILEKFASYRLEVE